ncbi:MAG: hypothetical protein IJP23_04860, partial [Oscillospiraceae bacterium]|nr:hypothetical protein [Oscillospiraceae bacterium]
MKNKRFIAKKVTDGVAGGVLGVVGVVARVVGTIVLIFITTALILACIFAFYVKNNLSPQLTFTLTDYSLSESSTIYYMDEETGMAVELQTLYGDENRIIV